MDITKLGAEPIAASDAKVGLPVVIGSDNAGYELKGVVADYLKASGIAYVDVNPDADSAPDYPLVSEKAGEAIASGACRSGVLVCGTGIGIGIAAAKCPGVYPARCDDAIQARLARGTTNANVLTFGQRVTGPGLALEIVRAFLTADYDAQDGLFEAVRRQEKENLGGGQR